MDLSRLVGSLGIWVAKSAKFFEIWITQGPVSSNGALCKFFRLISYMEGLLGSENILADQPAQTYYEDFGQPWQKIHRQMQSAISSPPYKKYNKIAVNKKQSLVAKQRQPTQNSTTIARSSIRKQTANSGISSSNVVKKQLKLRVSENQFQFRSTLVKERYSHLKDFGIPITQIKLDQLEPKENKRPKIGNLCRLQSFSETKANAEFKMVESLINSKQNQKQRKLSESFLVFPEVAVNRRALPSIYRSDSQHKHRRVVEDKTQEDKSSEDKTENNFNPFNQLSSFHQTHVFRATTTDLSSAASKVRGAKAMEIVLPINVAPATDILKQSKQNKYIRQIYLSQIAANADYWNKLKSIHSLDSKKKAKVISTKERHRSLSKLNASVAKKQYKSSVNSKESKDYNKDVSTMKKMKYRLYLKPEKNNLLR